MDQRSRFSYSVMDRRTALLAERLGSEYPTVRDLHKYLFPPDSLSVVKSPKDISHATRYFYYHALPLLESAELVKTEHWGELVLWSKVVIWLDMHLRYMDYAIDSQENAHLPLRLAMEYFFLAQNAIQQQNLRWESTQVDIYMQMFGYEEESRRGEFHDIGSLWRRVAPLVVVGDTYLSKRHLFDDFGQIYKRYLGWLLLDADCHDAVVDCAGGTPTPVTYLVNETNAGWRGDPATVCEVVASIREYLLWESSHIAAKVPQSCTIWHAILDTL